MRAAYPTTAQRVERMQKTAPRFVSTHPGSFVLLTYLAMVTLVVVFLRALGAAQGDPHDPRYRQTAIVFAVVLAFPFGRSMAHALQRPRLPVYPPRVTSRASAPRA
jgi:hypothetical protein